LQDKCSTIAESYETESVKAPTMLNRIEAAPECKSIIGLSLICDALTKIPRGSLSASRKAILSECQDQSVAESIGDFLRPAL
jgi:hypothetical protein